MFILFVWQSRPYDCTKYLIGCGTCGGGDLRVIASRGMKQFVSEGRRLKGVRADGLVASEFGA